MNRTVVPNGENVGEVDSLLSRLSDEMGTLSPQLRKAAAYVLDHPNEIGLSSVRELADAASVKPNTLVRLAQAVGFDGFEELREPFRDQLRTQPVSFPDRAQWLQELSAGDQLSGLYGEIAGAALRNLERMFSTITADAIQSVADLIVASRRTYVIGVGANFALAHNFAYLVGMATDNVVAVPNSGNSPVDSIVRAGQEDIVVAMTFEPYRSEVVETAEAARSQGATVVAITDSHRSPIATNAEYVLVAPSATPQFFPSTLAASALLETLASFIVADAAPEVVATIDTFHQRRYDLGVYHEDQSAS